MRTAAYGSNACASRSAIDVWIASAADDANSPVGAAFGGEVGSDTVLIVHAQTK